MTLSSTTSRISYPGAGSVGPFTVPFRITADGDLLVTVRDANNIETTLTLTTDYTVAGARDATCTVTLTAALAVGQTLVIRREPSNTQPTSIQNQGSYFPKTHEDVFDRLTMLVQALRDRVDRAFKMPETQDPATHTVAVRPEAGKVLGWLSATQLGNVALDSGAIAIPGGGRTAASLSAYLANNAYLFNVLDYGADGSGVADSRAAFALADAAAIAAGGMLLIPFGTFKISSDITLSAPNLWAGGKISVASGKTVSLLYLPIAPPRQIFAGSGVIRAGTTGSGWTSSPSPACAPPDWWGGAGNTGAFDTVAVQAAFDSGFPIRFARHYYVTHVLVEGAQKFIDFDKYRLIAVSTTANTDYCLGLQCYQSTLRRIGVQCPTPASSTTEGTSYKSLVRIFGDASHTNIQFNTFDFDSIENVAGAQLSAALVIGAHIGDTPYNTPISENSIYNMKLRGVERGVYCNQPNGKNSFFGCHSVVTQNEWPGANWSATRATAIRNDPSGAGEIEWFGGSIENNESNSGTGYGIRGDRMRIHGAVWEVSTVNLIEGDHVLVADNLNDAVGAFNVNVGAFKIAAGATGRLLLRNVRQYRTTNVVGSRFVDGTLAPNFLVVIDGGHYTGYRWSLSAEYSPFVDGCRLKIAGDMRFEGVGGVDFEVSGQDQNSRLTGFDATGSSFPAATIDQTAKGGWTHSTAGAVGNKFGISTDVPTSSGLTASIELQSIAGQDSAIQTPTGTSGFPVSAFKVCLFRFWLKIVTTGSNVRVRVYWYKRDGSASATASTDMLTATVAQLGFAVGSWYRVTQYVQAPADAQFASVQVYADNDVDLRVADLRMD